MNDPPVTPPASSSNVSLGDPGAASGGAPSAPRSPERRSVRLSPKLVLLILIGSCYGFGYAIYLLLKGMHR